MRELTPAALAAPTTPDGERRRRVAFGLALAAVAGGAGRAAAAATESVGGAAPRRIVSVGGALTETLYALGAQSEIVGVDTTSLYPEAARQLPSVGYQRTLSAEGVLSLAPTLVVATEDAGPPAVLRQLEAAKLALHVLDAGGHRFEGIVARTRQLAALTGREAAGEALAGRLEAEWTAALARVKALAAGHAPPRALFVMVPAAHQVRAAGRGTAADALIAYAGGHNVFAEVNGYQALAPEAAVAVAPEVIVTSETGLEAAGGIDGLLGIAGLAQTPAGRARHVIPVDLLMALGFGPRLPQAVTQLAERLHTPPGAR